MNCASCSASIFTHLETSTIFSTSSIVMDLLWLYCLIIASIAKFIKKNNLSQSCVLNHERIQGKWDILLYQWIGHLSVDMTEWYCQYQLTGKYRSSRRHMITFNTNNTITSVSKFSTYIIIAHAISLDGILSRRQIMSVSTFKSDVILYIWSYAIFWERKYCMIKIVIMPFCGQVKVYMHGRWYVTWICNRNILHEGY